MAYSLIKIFGSLPVHPGTFSTLDPKLKWLDTPDEGDSFCVTCGTPTPSIPRSHHVECCSHKDADEYEEQVNPLGNCPECGSDDGLHTESSREQQISAISCIDCMYQYSDSVDEETLTENFLKGVIL